MAINALTAEVVNNGVVLVYVKFDENIGAPFPSSQNVFALNNRIVDDVLEINISSIFEVEVMTISTLVAPYRIPGSEGGYDFIEGLGPDPISFRYVIIPSA